MRLLFAVVFALTLLSQAQATNHKNIGYEVWASDQSNSVADTNARGVKGSYIWIWDSRDIEKQIREGIDAEPLGCGRSRWRGPKGPCDLLEVFPQDLKEYDSEGNFTGNYLRDLDGFGRLHGMLPDPQQMYLTVNIFAPSGGYVGVIDRRRKHAVGLFRVTGVGNEENPTRSVHMSYFSEDGSQIIVANLNGKLLERIDVIRTRSGKIRNLKFNKSATLGVGKNQQVVAEATVFLGRNQHRTKMIGEVVGDYVPAAFDDLTPNGVCKENGCDAGLDAALGGRPNNVIICPVASTAGLAYVTLGAGGLFIVDTFKTPMQIVGEYTNQVVNGAGCGSVQTGDQMWLNAGVSASGAGATHSTFTMYAFDDNAYSEGPLPENTPLPIEVFKDLGNTTTNGNVQGTVTANETGQLPGQTTRRDAHGAVATIDGTYLHNVDRIQNVVEVFDTSNFAQFTYDLTSEDGKGSGVGACMAKSVDDDPNLPANDPAPDLLEATPDGKYLMVALRGPAPVSVVHSAQGSCPGVGIIELTEGGSSGKLIGVLSTTNTVDNAPVSAPGGHEYIGAERSDVHGATVISKKRRIGR